MRAGIAASVTVKEPLGGMPNDDDAMSWRGGHVVADRCDPAPQALPGSGLVTEPLGGIAGEISIQPVGLILPLAPADALELMLAPCPELCAGRVVRISVLADMAGGFRLQMSLPDSQDSMVTRDLTIRARPVVVPRAVATPT